ncbi:PAS domain S-box protein [Halobaculum lipolyticum]|uniref:histidine kinase n=1 Tax=Halobaculum lipolyticum TaxID=3032001 RepID=A0ABD5W5U3_9EURY|nr:PAS domain S-box protein [Halobaculum sp. DT31]
MSVVTVAVVAPRTQPAPPPAALGPPTETVRVASLDDVDASAVDCVVCTVHDGWADAVGEFRESWPEIPVVLAGPADPEAGALASRIGVEYAPEEAFEGSESGLWERVVDTANRAVALRERRDDASETYREAALRNLLSTSRELLTADDRASIPDTVARATAEVIGLEYALVRLYDPERGVLYPAGETRAVTESLPERPVYDADEGMPGRAFQSGEAIEYDGDEPELPDGDVAARIVPLGDHGTLTIGTACPDGFTETDRLLVSLLATSATTALDRAERVESLRTYRAIHENVKERVYVLDEAGEVRLTTDPLVDELGYDREDVVGRNVGEFLDADAARTGRELLADLRDDHPDASRTFETTLVAADGDRIPVEIELSLLPGEEGIAGSVGVVRNRQALEAERARFRSLFDRSPDAIVDAELGDDGPRIRTVNHTFEETFGVTEEAVAGDRLDDLVVPADAADEAADLDDRTRSELTTPVEVDRLTPDGTRTFLFRGVSYRRTAEGVRAFGIYTDIDDRKADRRRIEMLNRVLRHNIRNTINVVAGSVELARDRVDGDDARVVEHLDRAASAAERIAALPDDVKRVERAIGADPESFGRYDLRAAAERAAEAGRAFDADATVTVDVPPVSVRGDDRLGAAIDELVENAVVHGGDAPTVAVTATVDGDRAVLAVDDDGPGIPRVERAVIAGDVDITQLAHSRGLGLWVAASVVSAVGGDLSFPEPSTVRLDLPVCDG